MMFGNSVAAAAGTSRMIRLPDGTMWDSSKGPPPDVATAMDRNGPAGTPMGSPFATAPGVDPIPHDKSVPDGTTAAYEAVRRSGGMLGNSVSAMTPQAPPPPPLPPMGIPPMQSPQAPMAYDPPPLPLTNDAGVLTSMVRAPDLTPPKPKFFDKDGAWRPVLGTIGDALSGKPIYADAMRRQHEWAKDDAASQFEHEKFDWQKKKDARPEIRSAGRSIVSVPMEGQPQVLYSDPAEAERYAASIGLKPGDEGYAAAITDYVLKGNGPTAFGNRQDLVDQRFQNGVTMEGVKQGNRLTLKGTPTYGNLHPTARATAPRLPTTGNVVAGVLAKVAAGQPLTPGEKEIYSSYNSRGRRGILGLPGGGGSPAPSSGGYAVGQTATGPVRVSSPEQARRLAPGTVFITPDGRQKVR